MVVFSGFGASKRYQRLRDPSRENESHSFMFHYLSIGTAATDLLQSFLRAPQKTLGGELTAGSAASAAAKHRSAANSRRKRQLAFRIDDFLFKPHPLLH